MPTRRAAALPLEGSAPEPAGCRPAAQDPPSPPRAARPSSRCRPTDASPLLPRQLLPAFEQALSLGRDEEERTPAPPGGAGRARAGSTRGRETHQSAAGGRVFKRTRSLSSLSPSTSGDVDVDGGPAGLHGGGFACLPRSPPPRRKAAGGGTWLAPPPPPRGGATRAGGGGKARATAAAATLRPARRARTQQRQ